MGFSLVPLQRVNLILNTVEHFIYRLTSLPPEALESLLTITVNGPHFFIASILTRELRYLVQNEVFKRHAQEA